MEQERYQQQYKAFVQQAEQRLNELCDVYLPVKPKSAKQRVTACWAAASVCAPCWCWLPASWRAAIPQLQPTMPRRWKCCTAIP